MSSEWVFGLLIMLNFVVVVLNVMIVLFGSQALARVDRIGEALAGQTRVIEFLSKQISDLRYNR